MVAIANVTWKYRIEVFQHAELYGTDEDRKRTMTELSESLVFTTKFCQDFCRLSFEQMMSALTSVHLIASEDDILSVVMKWLHLNPKTQLSHTEQLYACIRLERLKDFRRAEELLRSNECPKTLAAEAMRLCMKKIQADVEIRKLNLNVHPGETMFFIRDQDGKTFRTHFSFGDLAFSAYISPQAVLYVKYERRERSFQKEISFERAAPKSFTLFIVETTPVAQGRIRHDICFAADPYACANVPLDESNLNLRDRMFVVIASDSRATGERTTM